MIRTAVMSPCGLYRYSLTREDDGMSFMSSDSGTVAFLLSNCSTADAVVDDRTITRCWNYAQGWGFRLMIIVNCNPYRATDPKNAIIPPEHVMAENDTHIRFAAYAADMVVCAYGTITPPDLAARALGVLKCQKPLYYLALSKDGVPKHPLYLPGELKPVLWSRS